MEEVKDANRCDWQFNKYISRTTYHAEWKKIRRHRIPKHRTNAFLFGGSGTAVGTITITATPKAIAPTTGLLLLGEKAANKNSSILTESSPQQQQQSCMN